MAAPRKHTRLLTRSARMLASLQDNEKHPRRAEYTADLAACRREWAALSKAERKDASAEAATIPDMTRPAIAAAITHLEG